MLELLLFALKDLKSSLREQGSNLMIRSGTAESIIEGLAKEVVTYYICLFWYLTCQEWGNFRQSSTYMRFGTGQGYQHIYRGGGRVWLMENGRRCKRDLGYNIFCWGDSQTCNMEQSILWYEELEGFAQIIRWIQEDEIAHYVTYFPPSVTKRRYELVLGYALITFFP